MTKSFEITGTICDPLGRRMFGATLTIVDGKIASIQPATVSGPPYILPGFIDAHIHVESSLLGPRAFSELAARQGTVATNSDPHEIANVCGLEGVEWMLEQAKSAKVKIFFGAPSCVPASPLERACAELDAAAVAELLKRDDIHYLSEVMNFPGVVAGQADLLEKINSAIVLKKPVDGHCPGLRGEPLRKYIDHGITTDHECYEIDEAREKIEHGMHILIREGSAAKNLAALMPLIDEHPERVMFCSDDLHPDDLYAGHINASVRRAVAAGCDLWNVLRAACVNPVLHYGHDIGLLRPGDSADFIVLEDLTTFAVKETYIRGVKAASQDSTPEHLPRVTGPNRMRFTRVSEDDLLVPMQPGASLRVIEARNGQLTTGEKIAAARIAGGRAVADLDHDILHICVVDREARFPVSNGFITNFGLKQGALASSVAHDSHHIICVGTTPAAMARAIEIVGISGGGFAVVCGTEEASVALPIGGLMSGEEGATIAKAYQKVDALAKTCGCPLTAPFITLSFMGLTVIGDLKLSNLGLADVRKFQLVPLTV